MPGSRVGTRPGVDLHAHAAARRHLGARAGEAGGTHVLDRDDESGRDELEAGLQQQLLGERIAHLDLRPPRLALLAQLLGGEARAVDAVPAGPGPDAEQYVAHARRRRADQVGLLQQAHAHGVDERVPGVALGKADLAAERGHADAVAVVAHAADDAGEEVAVPRMIERAEPEAVEHRDRPRAHREHVAQDPADARGRALIRLDRRRVVVRLDLERDRPALRQPEHAGVLAGALDDLRPGGGKRLEHRLRVLVRAVLRPERREDAQLGRASACGPASRRCGRTRARSGCAPERPRA